MAISMIEFSRAVFSMLSAEIDWTSRFEDLEVDRLRLSFSEEELKGFSSFYKSYNIETNSGLFAVLYSDKEANRYLIVSVINELRKSNRLAFERR